MFSKDEINTGRQIEFDYIKGLFVPMILLVHAFQMLDGMAPAYQVFYIAATMTGSAIFMFVLGLGRVLRICTDKCRLYRILAVPAGIIVMVYFVRTTRINDGLDALYTYSDIGYVYPSSLRALANCSCILLATGALYALRNRIVALNPLHRVLLHFNKETTPYYAVHPFYFGMIFAVTAYSAFSAVACAALTPVVWALCFITIAAWNHIRARGGRAA